MSPTTTTTTTQPTYDKETKEAPEEEVDLVENLEATDVATTRSPLGRRRSEKGSLVPSQESKEVPRAWHGKDSRKNTSKDESLLVDVCVHSCVSFSDLCSCVLHRVARAVLPPD